MSRLKLLYVFQNFTTSQICIVSADWWMLHFKVDLCGYFTPGPESLSWIDWRKETLSVSLSLSLPSVSILLRNLAGRRPLEVAFQFYKMSFQSKFEVNIYYWYVFKSFGCQWRAFWRLQTRHGSFPLLLLLLSFIKNTANQKSCESLTHWWAIPLS